MLLTLCQTGVDSTLRSFLRLLVVDCIILKGVSCYFAYVFEKYTLCSCVCYMWCFSLVEGVIIFSLIKHFSNWFNWKNIILAQSSLSRVKTHKHPQTPTDPHPDTHKHPAQTPTGVCVHTQNSLCIHQKCQLL